jgi:GH15 family glucan-1,4-alpha-glucosidase
MPLEATGRDPRSLRSHHSLLRRLRCTEGTVGVRVCIEPRFDYARIVPLCRLVSEESAEIVGGADSIQITATRQLDEEQERIKARWVLREGEDVFVEAAWAPSHQLRRAEDRPSADDLEQRLEKTVEFWKDWSARCEIDVADVGQVRRSALVLKALTYAPTGAVIAAPTTSLPEQIGGERNWDYRYTWIRDGTLTLISLFSLGIREEAETFRFFMERTSAGRPKDLQIMYGVAGERSLHEIELPHLAGHRGSRPVRIGNGAATQRQLDCYGQLVQAAYLFGKAGGRITPDNWNFLCGIADVVVETWREPDQGIWEIRDDPRHFVHSKLNCWAALDRMVKISEMRKLPGEVDRWSTERDALHAFLLDDATDRGWFAQAVGADAPDASVLLVPAMGFLPTTHPLVQKTIDVVRSELGAVHGGGLVHRYLAPDGLEGGEGSFLLCSYWLLDCLTFSGRVEEAEAILKELHGYANDVGLWAEEVDASSGEALGNFPQAFTHMAHVTSCLHLDSARKGLIDHDLAQDYAEHAVDRLLRSGQGLAQA